MQLKEGQPVHVEYDGVIHHQNPFETVVRDSSGKRHYYPDGAVTITAGDPLSWPPQIGDVWEAEGREYFVRENRGVRGAVVVDSFDKATHGGMYTGERLGEFKALNPTLLRRRD